MFAMAGFNPRARRLRIKTMIHRGGFRDWRPSQLVEFASGDLAWRGAGARFSWGTCSDLYFRQFIYLDHSLVEHPLAKSELR